MVQSKLISASDALQALHAGGEERFVPLLQRDTLEVEFYAPRGHDPQQPHSRDELYVVVSGSGLFFDGEQRRPFSPGDFIFIAAGVEHRFEEFSDDFATWVFFYGPQGGEVG